MKANNNFINGVQKPKAVRGRKANNKASSVKQKLVANLKTLFSSGKLDKFKKDVTKDNVSITERYETIETIKKHY